MLPVFRSKLSVLSFCILLIALLGLPLVTGWIGHPSREQAYAGMSTEVGPIGAHMREVFDDPSDADILFVGSSLVRAGVDEQTIERGLSAHTGHPAHIAFLSFNWQGLDLQYFLLRDYLKTHHTKLIVWNLPVPGSRNLIPHVEAFRWVRFGEYSDALSGLPLNYRLALYSDMVLGAPRELLSHLRPNLLSKTETDERILSESTGYYGSAFVPEHVDPVSTPPINTSFEPAPYAFVKATGTPLNAYEDHFAEKILALARQNGVKLALLHIPIDTERGLSYMPERSNWPVALSTDAPMIGVPSAILFRGIDKDHFDNFYRDQHFNSNGSLLFTESILPAVLKAYDTQDGR
jgi:hypothetical protein